MGADTNELGRKANVPNTKASYLPQSALGVIHQRRCSDLFGSLVDALRIKVRLKVTLGLVVLEANMATPTKSDLIYFFTSLNLFPLNLKILVQL